MPVAMITCRSILGFLINCELDCSIPGVGFNTSFQTPVRLYILRNNFSQFLENISRGGLIEYFSIPGLRSDIECSFISDGMKSGDYVVQKLWQVELRISDSTARDMLLTMTHIFARENTSCDQFLVCVQIQKRLVPSVTISHPLSVLFSGWPRLLVVESSEFRRRQESIIILNSCQCHRCRGGRS